MPRRVLGSVAVWLTCDGMGGCIGLSVSSAEKTAVFVRLSPEVRRLLEQNAEENERSLSAEAAYRLKLAYAEVSVAR
jgi:hypothetical protein